VQFAKTFSFDLVADQSKFRDSNGILLLLRILHGSPHDRSFQILILDILINVFAPIEENKKIIVKTLEDPLVVSKFLSYSKDEEGERNPLSSFPSSGSNQSLDHKEIPPPLSIPSASPPTPPSLPTSSSALPSPSSPSSSSSPPPSPRARRSSSTDNLPKGHTFSFSSTSSHAESFLSWYYSSDPDIVLKRTATEQRIEKLVFPLVTLAMKNREKVGFKLKTIFSSPPPPYFPFNTRPRARGTEGSKPQETSN